MLQRVSLVAVRNAHLSILRKNTSARTYICVPPCNYIRVGPKQLKIAPPYIRVETAKDYIS
jgi:hypothetical protein